MATFFNQATLTYNNNIINSNITTGEIQEVLTITKTAVLDTYNQDSEVTYVINIRNTGTQPYTGLTITEVNARASRLGLNVQMTGLVSGSADAAISNRQSVKEGETVLKGTVIEVNFYYQDTEEN